MEKVITKKSFVGSRLVYPGETIDVDAKGAVLPAGSTPIGELSIDQLEALLASRKNKSSGATFGGNVADADANNTGSQALEMAAVRPSGPGSTQPQVIPPGTIAHSGGFIRPAPDAAPAAIETVVAPETGSTLDRDGDGHPGGSRPASPPALTGKTKAELVAIADDEKVTTATDADGKSIPIADATNPQIVEAITRKRTDA